MAQTIVIKFVMWAAYNAYVLMDMIKPHAFPNKRVFTFHMFIEKLCQELVGDVRSTGAGFGHRRSAEFLDEKRLKRDAYHDVEKATDATGNNRCVVCRQKYLVAKQRDPRAKDKDLPKRCKTVYRCTECDEFLCIAKPDNNCWYNWHHKVEYWR